MSVTPSALDVQTAVIRDALSGVHTCLPAEIVRVHAEPRHKRQFVDVLPSLQRQAYNEDGEIVDETLPIIPMVPVGYYQGGTFFISVPLEVGDFVLLVFAERSLDQWLETARKKGQRAVIPGDVGTHTLEGAIALPCGPAPRSALLSGVHEHDLVIGGPGGILARFTPDGQVRLAEGVTGESYVALATKVDAELARVKADLAALKSAISTGLAAVGAGSAASGTLGQTAFDEAITSDIPSEPTSVAAAKVKAR